MNPPDGSVVTEDAMFPSNVTVNSRPATPRPESSRIFPVNTARAFRVTSAGPASSILLPEKTLISGSLQDSLNRSFPTARARS